MVGLLAVATLPGSAVGATLSVNDVADELNADGSCSLREAVQATNTNAQIDGCPHDGATGHDTINVPGQSHAIAVAPDVTPDDNLDGDLDLVAGTGGVTVDGAGAATVLDGDDVDRMLDVIGSQSGPVTISDLTIQDGSTTGAGGGVLTGFFTDVTLSGVTVKESQSMNGGGGVAALGDLEIADGSVIGPMNQVVGAGNAGGGGVYGQEALSINDSSVLGNQTAGGSKSGGGISSLGNETVISGSVISGNGSSGGGAGIGANGGPMTITSSQITDNQNNNFGGGISFTPPSAATVTVTGSEIAGNDARGGGGGISLAASGSLELIDSSVSNNDLETALTELIRGGGIANGGSGTAHIVDSTLAGNTLLTSDLGSASGGGLSNSATGTAVIERSTLSGNSLFGSDDGSHDGAAVANAGTLAVIGSTLASNTAADALFGGSGGLHQTAGTSQVIHTTIASNTAPEAKGIFVQAGSVVVRGSIVSEGVADACQGALTSAGYNIERTAAGPGSCGFTQPTDQQGTDPLLGALAPNGGPTLTMAVPPGSPAIDKVPAMAPQCTSDGVLPLGIDQRGLPRPSGAGCDAGAFELQVAPAPVTTTPPATNPPPKKKCKKKRKKKRSGAAAKRCKKKKKKKR
jgi:fibronectin-binding autotransporter adhesin